MHKFLVWIKKNQWFLIFAFIFFGLLLRLSALFIWPFGFDQVQILEAVDKILSGDPTLIGPRTGPAQMFTGPLIYYLTAFFYLLRFSYYSLIVSTLSIALLTGLSIYFLIKRYFGYRFAIIALFIWSFSEFFISIDQVTWNPNLTFLASSLVFFL